MFITRAASRIVPCRGFNVETIARNMTPILYGDEASPPVRFALMTASLLKIEITYKEIDLFKGENKTEFYTKINPLRKVPALQIGEEVICDSHAIALYLCRQKETQDLYPNDKAARARVDQMLFFNSGSLFPLDSSILTNYFAGKQLLDISEIEKWYNLLDYLELHLNKYTWLAGDKMSLCDICCAATVSSLLLIIPFHERHVKVMEWMENLKKLPFFEINSRGIQRLRNYVDMATNKKDM